jgi:hypothetical protein
MVDIRKNRSLKHTVTFIMLTILILAVQSPVAAEGLVLKASQQQGQKGEQVVVAITAENAAGTEGGQFLLTFDATKVKPVALEPGELITEAGSNLHMVNLEYAPGQLMFMWVTANADTADSGLVCSIIFELLNEGVSNILFGEVVVAPDGIGAGNTVPGRITVGDTEVDRDESDEDTGQEEDEEAVEGDQDDETAGEEIEEAEETDETEGEVSGRISFWLIALIVLLVAIASGFLIIRRSKINWSKQNK